jgi:hypothetical protein
LRSARAIGAALGLVAVPVSVELEVEPLGLEPLLDESVLDEPVLEEPVLDESVVLPVLLDASGVVAGLLTGPERTNPPGVVVEAESVPVPVPVCAKAKPPPARAAAATRVMILEVCLIHFS